MTSIERTAYPRFKRLPSTHELEAIYTPSVAELDFVNVTAHDPTHRLHMLIWLKSFQRLGYFPALGDVPAAVVVHLRTNLTLPVTVQPGYDQPRMLYRHQQAVRAYLGVLPFDDPARQAVVAIVARAATVLDNPADLINVALEELVRLRYELPAFSTLDRLVGHERTRVNTEIQAAVLARLTVEEIAALQTLLDEKSSAGRTPFQRIKEPPERATLTHLREWQAKLTWLLTLGDTDRLLAALPPAKVAHFAAEATALDASDLGDVEPAKRYTLLLCLIHRARIGVRDELATMLIKRMSSIQRAAQDELVRLREKHLDTTLKVVSTLEAVLDTFDDTPATDTDDAVDAAADAAPTEAILPTDAERVQQLRDLLAARGGLAVLRQDCATVTSYNSQNHLPLLWPCFQSHRAVLFAILRTLTLSSTTQDQALCKAAEFILAQQHKRGAWLPTGIDLSFASDAWQRLVLVRRRVRNRRKVQIVRRQLEVCVFTYLAHELKTGDLCVAGAEQYADYRTHLLPWSECASQVAAYCQELGFPATPGAFVAHLKAWLTQTAADVDAAFPDNKQVEINAKGVPTIKRPPPRIPSPTLRPLIEALQTRVPQRNLLDIVHTVEHWTHWSRHFGPLSGADPKIDNPRARYIVTAFTYGCNLGPAQMARHLRGRVSPHQLWHANHRHITVTGLDAALRDIINRYSRFALPRLWGKAKVAAADGTQFALNEASLASEYHIRPGSSGGVAYHHISDMYIALFSHFLVCGVWEGVYILDILKQNTSEIQPDTLHADTQGQSVPIFSMAHLLGIDLMPRIRNWKDLIFYRPSKDTLYQHIDPLFSDVIDWALIETHWQDLLQVVLSIKAGKVLPSTLLRKLTTYSRKNRLYQAFRELGRVVRTVFLLKYLARLELRDQIHAATNKVEVYNEFTQWLGFGGEEIPDKDPVEIEKRIKYRDLIANTVILQNTVDLSYALRELAAAGHPIKREDVAALSPYWTQHIKRFGDYVLEWDEVPPVLEEELPIPV